MTMHGAKEPQRQVAAAAPQATAFNSYPSSAPRSPDPKSSP